MSRMHRQQQAARCGRARVKTNDAGVVDAITAAARKMQSVRVSWRRFESMSCMRVRARADDGERFNWAVDGRMSGQQARPPAAEAASEPVAPHRLQAFDMVVDVVRI
jgi:hypothetical protein